jgi:hypothetical protein
MRRFPTGSALLIATLIVLPGRSEAQILPVSSFRDANVIVTVTDPSDWQSTGDQATSEETGAFDFDADFPLALGLAEARGIAAHHSTIGVSDLQASASLNSIASAQLEGASSVIATNDYQVTFSVAAPGYYSLMGTLSAGGEGICSFSFLGDGIDHTFEVQGGSVPLNFAGELPPGVYFLFANLRADVNVNLAESDSRLATGSFDFEFSVSSSPSAVGPGGVPARTALLGAFPNPFNPRTTIGFRLEGTETVALRVFDLAGRLVRTLVGGEVREPGRHDIAWNGRDDDGRRVASGTYFYRLEAGRYAETRSLVLVK